MHHYLPELAQAIFDSSGGIAGRVNLAIDVAPLTLLIDTALSCGLVLSELVSNSLEHAFPDSRSGSVSISSVRGDNGTYRFTVEDDGVQWRVTFSDDVYRERVQNG